MNAMNDMGNNLSYVHENTMRELELSSRSDVPAETQPTKKGKVEKPRFEISNTINFKTYLKIVLKVMPIIACAAAIVTYQKVQNKLVDDWLQLQ